MPPHPARQCTGAAVPTFSGRETARRRPTSTAEQLERLSSQLDELIRDVRLGTTSHRQHDRNVDSAEAIATGIRSAFRGSSGTHNPPLKHDGGRAWW